MIKSKKRARPPEKPVYINVGKLIQPHHIEAVKKFLPRGKDNAITMRALARRMRCSKGAAERRFNAYLKKYGNVSERVKFIPVREGDRGPLSVGFYL